MGRESKCICSLIHDHFMDVFAASIDDPEPKQVTQLIRPSISPEINAELTKEFNILEFTEAIKSMHQISPPDLTVSTQYSIRNFGAL